MISLHSFTFTFFCGCYTPFNILSLYSESKRLKTDNVSHRREDSGSSFLEVAVPLRFPSYLSPSDYSHAADIGNDHRIMAEEENSCGTEEETIESYGITQEDSQYQDKEDDMEAELDSMWQEMFETPISDSEECDLRDCETAEDDGDFEEVIEEVTLTECDSSSEVSENIDGDSTARPEDRRETSNEKQPLYPGANVTIGALMVLLSLYAVKYDLTSEAITQLLKIISLILPCGKYLTRYTAKIQVVLWHLR